LRDLRLFVVAFFSAVLARGFSTDFFVVLFEGSQIFSGFGEFSFFHTFSDVPVDEGSLGVHEIEFVVNSSKDFRDGGGVGQHAHSSLDLGQIASRDDSGGLVVDTALEASGAPVNELDGSLGLDDSDGSVDVLGDNVSSVHKAASHVLAVSRVALGHHVGGLEGRVGQFGNRELFVVSLFSRNDRGIRAQHKVDSRVRNQVSLEFSNIDVQGTIESEGSSQRGNDLGNQSVQVGVSGSFNVEGSSANVVDGFIIQKESNISVFQERVGGQHRVVRLNDGGGDLGRGVDAKVELGLLAVVNRQSFEQQRSKTRSSSSSNGLEDKETLETSALVSKLSDSVEAEVDDFLTNGVVTTGVVVGSIFFASNQLFGVEQLSVGTSSDFIDDSGFKIEEDSSGDVLASSSFREKGVESIITVSNSLVRGHLAIRLDAVFKAVEFPAGITDLDTSLTDVDGNNFSHDYSIVTKGGFFA
jgi:hypothetical protein